jgi:hypothetical protein
VGDIGVMLWANILSGRATAEFPLFGVHYEAVPQTLSCPPCAQGRGRRAGRAQLRAYGVFTSTSSGTARVTDHIGRKDGSNPALNAIHEPPLRR